MDVTLLYLDDCPHWRTTDARVREALTRTGRTEVPVVHRRVTSPEEAEAAQFRGSPTVLIDGRDPFFDPVSSVGFSCRVYRTHDGLAGSPTVDQLVAVLQ